MSMVAVIRKLTTEDLGEANASFDRGMQKIKDNILGGVVNIESEHVNDRIAVSGIVQNEMTLTAVNDWKTSLYSGISDALERVQIGGGLAPASVKGSSLLKFANTVAAATGYNIAGTGPASKKIYQGSNLSGFSITLKWYTPKSKKWKKQITNLTSLAWPVYMGREKDNKPIDFSNAPAEGFMERVKGVLDGLGNIVGGAIDNLIARNPEKVMLTITHNGEEIYKLTPLVITSFTLQGSRETSGGYPIIMTATINFDYYQINASGSTATKQTFGGAPIFATPQIISQRSSAPNNSTSGLASGLASGSRVQVSPGSRSVRLVP